MNEMKVHHVGYLVKNIEKAKNAFCGTLGFEELAPVVRDEGRKADICFVQSGTFVVELVSPYSGDSVAGGDLFKRFKNAPYHICLEANDFDADIERIRTGGFVQIDQPQPAPAIGGRRVVFFVSPSIGLIELLEEKH